MSNENIIKAPIFPYDEIRNHADHFLIQYHPGMEIPIPIEEIAEFQMGLNIVPIPGLLRAFDVDGFTSSDLFNIYVNRIQDEDISLQENWDFAWDLIAAQLAKEFEVSPEVIEKRLSKDKVMDMYR